MNVQEMHIGFDIRLAAVASNQYDSFLPEEVDWLLNQAQNRLIKSKQVSEPSHKMKGTGVSGFQHTIPSYDGLEELVTQAVLPMFVKDDESVFSVLPYNYRNYLNAKAKSKCNSKGLVLTTVANSSLFTGKVSFPNVTPNPLADTSILLDDGVSPVTIFDINNYTISSTLSVNAQKFVVINLILEEVNKRSDVKVRWEQYGEDYTKGYFYFETLSTSGWTGIIFNVNTVTQVTDTFVVVAENVYTTASSNVVSKGNCRLIRTEYIHKMNSHPFGKTKVGSPTVVLQDGTIIGYFNSTFIIDEITLTYLRKPRRIDLSLDQNCELAVHIHDEVVDKAVQLASAYINSDTYRNIINENSSN